MKSVVMSLLLLTSAGGSVSSTTFCDGRMLIMSAFSQALNVFISPFSRDPNLVVNYACIALATFIAGNVFYYVFWRRDMDGTLHSFYSRDLYLIVLGR